MLVQCWASVEDDGSTLYQHWLNVPCSQCGDQLLTMTQTTTSQSVKSHNTGPTLAEGWVNVRDVDHHLANVGQSVQTTSIPCVFTKEHARHFNTRGYANTRANNITWQMLRICLEHIFQCARQLALFMRNKQLEIPFSTVEKGISNCLFLINRARCKSCLLYLTYKEWIDIIIFKLQNL